MSLESTPIDSSKESESKTDQLTFPNACIKGNLSVVKNYFAQLGFDMNIGDNLGRTGFHLACYKGNLNVVQFFLQKGFDINCIDSNGLTGFHIACTGGKLNKFLEQEGFAVPGDNGIKGLHGNLNVVQFLLQQGFDMNIGDNNGVNGFHIACVSDNLNIVQFLLQQGFDMNIGDTLGSTGFIWACLAGNFKVIRFLLQHGFQNVNEFSIEMTGLDILIGNRNDYVDDELYVPCIISLIEAGAEWSNNDDIFEELISAIQNRIIEITFMKKTIFEKWTGRIAKLITDFTMDPFTNINLQNLSQFLFHYDF